MGNKNNHSLRVAGATSLFAAGVPERVIKGHTWYERVTKQQELAVSKILSGEVDSYMPELVAYTCESETSATQFHHQQQFLPPLVCNTKLHY